MAFQISENMNIAIIEDDFIITMLLERVIARQGHTICGKASSAREGLALIKQEKPDLVLLDIKLHGNGDGISLAKDLKKFDTKVVFITGNTDKKTREEAAKTEPLAYLIKPIDLDELKATLQKATD